MTPERSLAREARLLGRYLVGIHPDATTTARYVAAHLHLEVLHEPDSAAVRLVRRWPMLLAPIDSACGLLRRDDLLRRKLIVMAALLETTPRHAKRFLPARGGRVALAMTLLVAGVRHGVQLLVGVPVLMVALHREAR